jgi:hypothetical protein
VNPLLDPGPASEAGRAHGQLASALAGGGLVLSSQKLVEIGARALLLIAPGLFRFDARPGEDSLQVMTRALGPFPPDWATEENPPEEYGATWAEDEVPYRASWRVEVHGDPPLAGRVRLLTTLDAAAGVRHFSLHAVVREADRMPPPFRT